MLRSYCSKRCQKKDWKGRHRHFCNTLKERQFELDEELVPHMYVGVDAVYGGLAHRFSKDQVDAGLVALLDERHENFACQGGGEGCRIVVSEANGQHYYCGVPNIEKTAAAALGGAGAGAWGAGGASAGEEDDAAAAAAGGLGAGDAEGGGGGGAAAGGIVGVGGVGGNGEEERPPALLEVLDEYPQFVDIAHP